MHEVELIADVRIPTGDPDVTLAADLYRPRIEARAPQPGGRESAGDRRRALRARRT
jgi:hypothetical protein